MEQRTIVSQPRCGVVVEMREPLDLHGDDIVIVEMVPENPDASTKMWLPLHDGQSLSVGQAVTINSITEFHPNGLGGSRTTFAISPIEQG